MELPQKIVEVALALFYQQGFHATGVEQIREAAAVSKKTLYKYFATKEALILAVLQQRHQDFMQQLCDFVSAAAVPARPATYLAFIDHWAQQPGFNGCLFIHAVAEFADPTSAPYQVASEHKQQIRKVLAEWCEQAGLAHSSQVASQLFILGEGLIVHYNMGGSALHWHNWLSADLTAPAVSSDPR